MVKKIGRRKFIKTVGIVGSTTIIAPYIKTATSAGKLSLGIWDHWIPGANDVLVVKPTDESVDNKERLIPFLKEETITKVDLLNKTVYIKWPKYF